MSIENANYEVITDTVTPTAIRVRAMTKEDVLAKAAIIPTNNTKPDGSFPLFQPYNQLLSRNPTTLKYANEGYARNSIIFTILTKRAQSIYAAPLVVRDKKTKEPLPDSDYQRLLDSPNIYMDAADFWQQSSIYVDVGGTSFTLKVRDEYGVVTDLYPYHGSQINYVQGNQRWVECYRYDNGVGFTKFINVEDICELRFPSTQFLYPYRTESPLIALAKEVDTDNQRGELEVALLLNGGAPAFAIYPGESIEPMTQDQMNTIMEGIMAKINGRNRGRPLLMNKDFKLDAVGYSPKEMLLTEFSKIPESRACTVYGIAPGYAGFLTGLEYAGTYANRDTDRRSFFEETMVGLWTRYARAINRSFGGDNRRAGEVFHDGTRASDCIVEFDYSNLPALMEASEKLQSRIIDQWKNNLIPHNRALGLLGEEAATDGTGLKYFFEMGGTSKPLTNDATIPAQQEAD